MSRTIYGRDALRDQMLSPLRSAPSKVFSLAFLLLKSLPDLLITSKWEMLSVRLIWNPSRKSGFLTLSLVINALVGGTVDKRKQRA